MNDALYIDCVGGVAGDMLLGALLDAGVERQLIDERLATMVPGIGLTVDRTERHGIAALRVAVEAEPEQAHRRWRDVRELVDRAGLSPRAAAWAHDAFRRLAVAEGRVHGIDPESVHFHEVGAVDAIADICGVAAAVDALGVQRVVCSPLPLGRGFVRAAHGRLPLPAPAVLGILEGVPIHGVDLEAELVTPTGAALVCALADEFGKLPAMHVGSVGYGAGARDLEDRPNVVRVVTGASLDSAAPADVLVLETNLDDLPPDLVPDAAEACFAAGALDVWCTPVQMKKGRPGITLAALTRPDSEREVARAMLRTTTTLGVRVSRHRRWEAERRTRLVHVAGQAVRVKVGTLDGEVVNVSPEHDDCAAVARRTGDTVAVVWMAALAAAGGDDHA